MNMTFKRHVLAVAAVAAIVVVLGAVLFSCGGGGGGSATAPSSSSVRLTGSIGSGYQPTAKPSPAARVLEFFGFSSVAYAIADPIVDSVLAIPMNRGGLSAGNMANSVTASVSASNPSFTLSLSTAQDWLLMLIDSSATGTARFIGSLSISTAGTGSVLNFPATDAAIASLVLGTVTRDLTTSDAVSSATITATDFNMTASQLATLAKTDGLFRNARNIVNNYGNFGNPAGVYYRMRTDGHWKGDYSLLTTTFSNPSYTSAGTSFQLDTNTTDININQLCNGSVVMNIIPSTPVSDGSNTHASFTNNGGETCGSLVISGVTYTQVTSGQVYGTNAYGGLSGGPAGWFTSIPTSWEVQLGDGVTMTRKAFFDMASVNPPMTIDGRPKGFVPSFKLNLVSGETVSGRIESVDVKWHYYDEALDSYILIPTTDLKILKHAINSLEVKFDVSYGGTRKTCEMYFDPTTTTNVVPSNLGCADAWYYNDPTHPATNTGLMGYYETGGFGYFFDFFVP